MWEDADERPIIRATPNFACLTGLSAEEAASSKISYTSLIHPDDMEALFQSWQDWKNGDQA